MLREEAMVDTGKEDESQGRYEAVVETHEVTVLLEQLCVKGKSHSHHSS